MTAFTTYIFWATVCKTVLSMLWDRRLFCLSVCNVGVLWPNGCMDQDATWYGGRPRLLDREPAPPPQKGGGVPPQFSAHVHCGQTAGWMKMTFGMEVGLGPGHIVLDHGTQLHRQGHSTLPHFRGLRTQNRGPCLLWPNDRPSQHLLSSCLQRMTTIRVFQRRRRH